VGNRRAFDVQLEEFWQQMRQHGRPFALLLVDIDYFKPYNDHYGHQAGDHILADVASAMVSCLRSGQARAFRYGGEEFAILLQTGSQDELQHIAQRLLQQVAALEVTPLPAGWFAASHHQPGRRRVQHCRFAAGQRLAGLLRPHAVPRQAAGAQSGATGRHAVAWRADSIPV
jgi:GGDEF domain-containing protein